MGALGQVREVATSPPLRPAEGARAPHVRTLLICDLADSTALVERLGDAAAAELIRRHDRVARDLLQRFRGREIDKTDGFLLLFERPIEAVGFALAYQRALRALGAEVGHELRARVGIHVGEVVLWENTRHEIDAGAKPMEVEGLAKPVVARLMGLALPGQIVLSGVAFTLAQRAAEELDEHARLRWLTHGRYRFKGVPAPMLVHEVGEAGVAPLHAPPSGSKAERDVPLWRKPGVLALEVLALLTAIAVPFVLSLRAPPAIAFGERDWVVVGELRNLTRDARLDESLETAFRISLEQSRYVNVLSDLKLRDTLARMQRPRDTALDRAVASEIALREGARAVILPTVAEVGGRVRVSAEVIDPNTQTTVYAESADGVGTASALESIDAVTHELRGRLGEALAAIEKDSSPLPQVTSADLDALRAYALGVQAYGRSEYPEASALFDRAIELDPGFALAYIGRARVLYVLERLTESRRAAERALEFRDRLTPRDRLYVDAWQTMGGPTAAKLEKWEVLATMYPDHFGARYNYALFALHEANRAEDALRAIAHNDVPQNPFRDEAVYLRGDAQLALDRVDLARESFRAARQLGGVGRFQEAAAAHAAARDYPAADAEIAAAEAPSGPIDALEREEFLVALHLDRGEFDRPAATPPAAPPGVEEAEDLAGAELIAVMRAAALEDEAATAAALAAADAILHRQWQAHPSQANAQRLAVLAYLSARNADARRSERAAAAATAALRAAGQPNLDGLLALVRAEQLGLAGKDEEALAALEAAGSARDLVQTDSVRLRALRRAGRLEAAAGVAQRLQERRGAAWFGGGALAMLRVQNVLDANLAGLDAAELAAARGEGRAAERALAAFLARWPAADTAPAVARRIARLRDALRDF